MASWCPWDHVSPSVILCHSRTTPLFASPGLKLCCHLCSCYVRYCLSCPSISTGPASIRGVAGYQQSWTLSAKEPSIWVANHLPEQLHCRIVSHACQAFDMCWCFPFGLSNSKSRKPTSSSDRKRREKPVANPLHGNEVPAIAEVQEKRRSREMKDPARTKSHTESAPTRTTQHRRQDSRPQQDYRRRDMYGQKGTQRPDLNLQVPNMWYRSVDPASTHSSQEMLLNPRPHRSTHDRQRHPKRSSQSTLRGRGAKRDPPRHSKSKKNLRQEPSRAVGWSFFSPPPAKTQSRRDRNHSSTEAYSPSHRSSRHHATTGYQQIPESQPQSQLHSQPRHRSRQQQRQAPSSRSARLRTPNTAAQRTPDRRFAVLAATNDALEDLRREAFAQPSPPPRRERLRRYEGVTIPTSSIPFNWDCVSSSQTSAGYGESSSHRRSRRR